MYLVIPGDHGLWLRHDRAVEDQRGPVALGVPDGRLLVEGGRHTVHLAAGAAVAKMRRGFNKKYCIKNADIFGGISIRISVSLLPSHLSVSFTVLFDRDRQEGRKGVGSSAFGPIAQRKGKLGKKERFRTSVLGLSNETVMYCTVLTAWRARPRLQRRRKRRLIDKGKENVTKEEEKNKSFSPHKGKICGAT